jgi:FtsZ-binding cell division protein ZapB
MIMQDRIDKLEAELVEALDAIAKFQTMATEVIILRDENAQLREQVTTLQAKLDATKTGNQFQELATGWMETSIGKRVMGEPSIDTAPFLLGVMCNNFTMIQRNYRYILGRFAELGKPASPAEMSEINDLLLRTGFITAPK